MPRSEFSLDDATDFRVYIRTPEGRYLAGDEAHRCFAEEREQAAVFRYLGDHIPEQLELIQKTEGLVLVADPVPPEEIYETCDVCRELFMPVMTFFDGKRFLCADCRRRMLGSYAKAALR